MIKCPATGRDVSTGIEIDGDTFASLPDVSARMTCPACGGYHVWSKGAAWLADLGAADGDPEPTPR